MSPEMLKDWSGRLCSAGGSSAVSSGSSSIATSSVDLVEVFWKNVGWHQYNKHWIQITENQQSHKQKKMSNKIEYKCN